MLWSLTAHGVAIALLCTYPPPAPRVAPVPPPSARVTLIAPARKVDLLSARLKKRPARAAAPVPHLDRPAQREIPPPEAPRMRAKAAAPLDVPFDQPRLEAPPRPRAASVRAAGFESAPVEAHAPPKQARLNIGSFQSSPTALQSSAGAGRQAETLQGGFAGVRASRPDGKPSAAVGIGGFGGATSSGEAGPARTAAAAGFAPVTVEKAAIRASHRELAAKTTPVEILAKPAPAYTEQARARRIEGEVLLHVRFAADGRAEVLRVIRGLGYGLDESAADAVRAIEYRPAMRDGIPIDAALSVSVAFRLAY